MDKKSLKIWINKKEKYLQVAADAIKIRRKFVSQKRYSSSGFKCRYPIVDAELLKWRDEKKHKKGERILKWRLQEQPEVIGAKYGIAIGQDWVEKWSQRHKKSNQSEQRQHKLSIDEQIKDAQCFHVWQRSIAENPQFVLYTEDYGNAGEVPDSLVAYLSKCIRSTNDVGTDNVVRLSSFTPNDSKRLCGLLIVPIVQQQRYRVFISNNNSAAFQPRPEERRRYDTHVHVSLTPGL